MHLPLLQLSENRCTRENVLETQRTPFSTFVLETEHNKERRWRVGCFRQGTDPLAPGLDLELPVGTHPHESGKASYESLPLMSLPTNGWPSVCILAQS